MDIYGKSIEYNEILTDTRIIKAICKKYNMQYDKDYKYIIETNNLDYTLSSDGGGSK